MATTYNFTNGSISGQPKAVDTLPNTTGLFVRSNYVDFSNQTLEAGESDVAQVINIPADTWVLQVVLRVITADDTNATVNVGYGAGDTWGDGVSLASTGNVALTNNSGAAYYFSSADTIDITATTDTADVDIDGAVIEIAAVMMPGVKSDKLGSTPST